MSGSFALLDFGLEVSLDVGYQEHAAGGHLVDDQDVVRLLSDLHGSLHDQAFDADESLVLITERPSKWNEETPHARPQRYEMKEI